LKEQVGLATARRRAIAIAVGRDQPRVGPDRVERAPELVVDEGALERRHDDVDRAGPLAELESGLAQLRLEWLLADEEQPRAWRLAPQPLHQHERRVGRSAHSSSHT